MEYSTIGNRTMELQDNPFSLRYDPTDPELNAEKEEEEQISSEGRSEYHDDGDYQVDETRGQAAFEEEIKRFGIQVNSDEEEISESENLPSPLFKTLLKNSKGKSYLKLLKEFDPTCNSVDRSSPKPTKRPKSPEETVTEEIQRHIKEEEEKQRKLLKIQQCQRAKQQQEDQEHLNNLIAVLKLAKKETAKLMKIKKEQEEVPPKKTTKKQEDKQQRPKKPTGKGNNPDPSDDGSSDDDSDDESSEDDSSTRARTLARTQYPQE